MGLGARLEMPRIKKSTKSKQGGTFGCSRWIRADKAAAKAAQGEGGLLKKIVKKVSGK